MATIRGIFEPFYSYVQKQLNIRRWITSNVNAFITGKEGTLNLMENPFEESKRFSKDKMIWGEDTKEGFREYTSKELEDKELTNIQKINPHSFYKLTTEKQCMIRMASGVDVRLDNDLLDTDNSEIFYVGPRLAAEWILEGGGTMGGSNDYYTQDIVGKGGGEEGVNIRNQAKEGYGIVPSPGIIDAEISTKSEDGSLREAKVNFVCHNKRQLEILEALYMRPGYPILLEWGWVPFINNNFEVNNEGYNVLPEFFNPTSDFDVLNDEIRSRKEESSGNYDGFIGFCKNFSFKAREDGGFDCTTSIIAQAEILGSLKSTTKRVPKLQTFDDIKDGVPRIRDFEPVDEFLYYLRAIKANLDRAGDAIWIEKIETENFQKQQYTSSIAPDLGYLGDAIEYIDELFTYTPTSYQIVDNEGTVIDRNYLNSTQKDYSFGWIDIQKLIKDVAKVNQKKLNESFKGFYHYPDLLKGGGFGRKGDKTPYGLDKRNNYLGFDSFFEGTILKELSLEDKTQDSSGIKKKIFVRWDLICQILNKKTTPKYKKNTALTELTYLHPNQPTYHKGKPEEGKILNDKENPLSYIEYSYRGWDETKGLFRMGSKKSKIKGKNVATYKDTGILGGSFDTNICLMPHQINEMQQVLLNDAEGEVNSENYKNRGGKKGLDILEQHDALFQPNFTSFKHVEKTEQGIGYVYLNLDFLIQTYEKTVLEEYKVSDTSGETQYKRRLKKEYSFLDFATQIWNGVNDACGGYYDFGLHTEHERPHVARVIDFTFSGKSANLKRDIFQFDPQGLLALAREATYSSKLDADFSSAISIAAQAPNEIHSLEALSFKAFHKNIKNRFTDSLFDDQERNIMITEAYGDYTSSLKDYENIVDSLNLYIKKMNVSNYESGLVWDRTAFKENAYLKESIGYEGAISPSTATSMAKELEIQRIKLQSRYPEFTDDNGKQRYDGTPAAKGHYTGQYRKDTTHYRNAIIPLTTTLTIDGISGIIPLNIFQINSEKLPKGYQNPNITFVVKTESQKITAGQDWTTTFTGYLSLLNDNPNKGKNEELKTPPTTQEKELGSRDLYNVYVTNTAWSACFISYCVQEAVKYGGLNPPLKWIFKDSWLHTTYFQKNKDFGGFKHLDPKTTKIRKGDILLQGREGNIKGVKYPGPYSGISHANIVTSIKDDGTVSVVGGNMGSNKPGTQGVRKRTFKLEPSAPILGNIGFLAPEPEEEGFYLDNIAGKNTKAGLGSYREGSILRGTSAGLNPGYNGEIIGNIAKAEYDAWGKDWTELSIEAEETMRKYYDAAKIPPPQIYTFTN